jgi:UDP-N-acetylglucosamine 2-epimerase (non-hydrolysing)
MRILVVLGTRPEAIKLAPIINELKKNNKVQLKVCTTAQHRAMVDQILSFFKIKIDYDLNLMKKNQTLEGITCSILKSFPKILLRCAPDIILVQGDTTTAFATALVGFYHHITVAHVEAGLRTYNIYSPWPEELNRRFITTIASLHFAPTTIAATNLLREGVSKKNIFVCGNTVVDALLQTSKQLEKDKTLSAKLRNKFPFLASKKKTILVTGHRRESHGDALANICHALKKLASNPNWQIIYPVHPNPKVKTTVYEMLAHCPNVMLTEPLNYHEFVYLMKHADLIITDSGGIQEEAPTFKKPILITRDCTERPEVVTAGFAQIVGTNPRKIVQAATKILTTNNSSRLQNIKNPYGDGDAAKKIVKKILLHYGAES